MHAQILNLFKMKPLLSILSLAILTLISCTNAGTPNTQPSTPKSQIPNQEWWKEAVIYQVYPRSFKDSNGDGVGDLKGIISKLDYIKSLGVDAVWFNPIYSSPNDDNGYDVSDYQNIMAQFGTMADFDELLKGMHDRNIKIVMDLVVNHSSDEHEWFKQSRSSRTSPYRDYYHWWNAEKGKPTYRWSFFDVKHEAWKYDSLTNAYYLHYFSKKQPDLNWENPKLRQEIYKMMRYWADKGVDGFRMDAFQFASKDTTWPQFPPNYEKQIIKWYGSGPHLHDYIQEMNREVMSKYNIMTVAEGAGTGPEDAMKFVDPDRKEFSMAYHFEGMDIGFLPNAEFRTADPNYSLLEFKQVYTKWDSAFAQKGWNSIYLASHDQPRMVSRWGNDAPQWRELSAKMLNTFILTMRGTPYCYYGDELGMDNINFDNIEDYNDVETVNQYQTVKARGGNVKKFLEARKSTSRENGRTPMQWDNTPNSGFTTGKPWLKVNKNYTTINVAAQEKDPNSILNYFRSLIKLRKQEKTLIYGKYTLLDKENPNIYAYTREWEGKKFLILLNFKTQPAPVNLKGLDLTKATRIQGNYPDPSKSMSTLRPYEAVIYAL